MSSSKYHCDICEVKLDGKKKYDNHLNSKTHIMKFDLKDYLKDIIDYSQYPSNYRIINYNNEEVVQCLLCRGFFNFIKNYYTHKKTCKSKVNNDNINNNINNNNKDNENIKKQELLVNNIENELVKKMNDCENQIKGIMNNSEVINKEKMDILLNFKNIQIEMANFLKEKQIEMNTKLNEAKIKHLEEMLKITKEVSEKGREDNQKALNILNNNSKTNKSAIELVKEFIKNPVCLKEITDFTYVKNTKTTLDTIRAIVYDVRRNLFVKTIGDHIVPLYKMDDIKKQSLFTTDMTRLNYLVCLFKNTKITWIVDKKGNKVKDKIIKPIAKNIMQCIENFYELVNKGEIIVSFDERYINECIYNLKCSIENGDFIDQVNKYISPYFANYQELQLEQIQ